MAALHFVEEGKLDLDEDVNRRLVSCKVPEKEYTKTEKVTLHRILSHSQSLTRQLKPLSGRTVTSRLFR